MRLWLAGLACLRYVQIVEALFGRHVEVQDLDNHGMVQQPQDLDLTEDALCVLAHVKEVRDALDGNSALGDLVVCLTY